MHSKVMRFLVDFSVVVGIIISIVIAAAVNSATGNDGLGFLAFIVSLVIIEVALAGEGMKVEQAENLAKIAENTEKTTRYLEKLLGEQPESMSEELVERTTLNASGKEKENEKSTSEVANEQSELEKPIHAEHVNGNPISTDWVQDMQGVSENSDVVLAQQTNQMNADVVPEKQIESEKTDLVSETWIKPLDVSAIPENQNRTLNANVASEKQTTPIRVDFATNRMLKPEEIDNESRQEKTAQPEVIFWYCTRCGEKNAEDYLYCMSCGNPHRS